jgi:hypothetical protein
LAFSDKPKALIESLLKKLLSLLKKLIWMKLQDSEIGDVLVPNLEEYGITMDTEFINFIKQSSFHRIDGHLSEFQHLDGNLLHIIEIGSIFSHSSKCLPMPICRLYFSILRYLSTENAHSLVCDADIDFLRIQQEGINLCDSLILKHLVNKGIGCEENIQRVICFGGAKEEYLNAHLCDMKEVNSFEQQKIVYPYLYRLLVRMFKLSHISNLIERRIQTESAGIIDFEEEMCVLVGNLCCFDISILFHYIYELYRCFELCNHQLNSFWMINDFIFDFVYFIITKDGADCNLFYSKFLQKMVKIRPFSLSAYLKEMKGVANSRIERKACAFFVNWNMNMNMNMKEGTTDQFFVDDENQLNCYRQVLRMSGGSSLEGGSTFLQKKSNTSIEIDPTVRIIDIKEFSGYESLTEVIFSSESDLQEIRGFQQCTSLHRIEIPSSVKAIKFHGFFGCTSLTDIIFSSESHLREIDGFHHCTSLRRIEIPSSVEVIGLHGFYGCTSLTDIIFSSESHLREIHGFQECTTLYRIEIPSSVKVIGKCGFIGCTSLRVITIHAGCRMRANEGLRAIRSFIVYEADDVKTSRSLFHLGIGGRRTARRCLL